MPHSTSAASPDGADTAPTPTPSAAPTSPPLSAPLLPGALLGLWRIAWRVPLLVAHLLIGLLIAGGWRALHPCSDWPSVPAPIIKGWHRLLLRILGIRLEWLGERSTGGGMVVANHISWADISVLAALGERGFVSKAEVADWPVVGFLARSAATVFIERGRPGATRRALADLQSRLERGERVVVFPEGTTTDGHGVLPFFPLLLSPPVRSGSKVLPVAITYPHSQFGVEPRAPYTGDDSLGRNLWRLLWNGPIRCRASWLEPVEATGDTRELAATLQRNIAAALKVPALDKKPLVDSRPHSAAGSGKPSR